MIRGPTEEIGGKKPEVSTRKESLDKKVPPHQNLSKAMGVSERQKKPGKITSVVRDK